jgi:hypothetical protein
MTKTSVVSILLLSILILVPVQAQKITLPENSNRTLIEDNLVAGLNSGNAGLERSCALMLGSIESDRAVIPLLETLHNDADSCVRIAAAWALCMIGDSRGVYAVKMAVKYDNCSRVRSVCAWYYENYVRQGTFAFPESDTTILIANSEEATEPERPAVR